LGGVITVRSYVQASDAEKWISHTLEVRSLLGKQLVAVTQAESNMRAYLLTGLPPFRQTAEDAAADARARIAALGPLMADNVEQAGRLRHLNDLTQRRLDQVAQRMDVFDAKGLAFLQPELRRSVGGRLSTELYEASQAMDQAEAVLLPQREGRALLERRKAMFFLAVTLLGSALALLVLARSIWREVAVRGRVERELSQLNADLEQRVHQRGLEIEDRYRQFVDLFQFSPDGLVMTDADGCIRRLNRRAEEMFGWRQAEAEGLAIEHFLPGDMRAGHVGLRAAYVLNPEQRAMTAGRPKLLAQRKDGTTFPVDVSLCPIKTPEGQMIVASVRDISERQRAEQEVLRYRDHLQELVTERTAELQKALLGAASANVAKSHFLANMSHEIRTPLGAIVGMARLVRKGTLSIQQADKLDKLEAAANHVIATINDILDLSKIEADKLQLEQAPVDIAALVDTVLNIVEAQAQEKQLTLRTELAPMPAGLLGDATRIRQALLNYASNAIKFTETGSVTLRATVLEDGVDNTLVRFEVSDTGIGVPPQKMDRLFGLFEQADSTINRRFGGSGLGLAITKRLAKAMDGAVGVDSTLGKGST
ncbi:MAG: PAS domain S-box protein, partial [Rhodoferax sp.]|nr:PAS domain S-box protein [Rhodoferax sp.]